MPLPVAVDTSVLVSNANREHLVTVGYETLYRPVWSAWIIAELNQVMTWNGVRNKGLHEREQRSRRYKDMMPFKGLVTFRVGGGPECLRLEKHRRKGAAC